MATLGLIEYADASPEVRAVFALFGHFYVGLRCPTAELGKLLSGELPKS